jgi:hypothetical protein
MLELYTVRYYKLGWGEVGWWVAQPITVSIQTLVEVQFGFDNNSSWGWVELWQLNFNKTFDRTWKLGKKTIAALCTIEAAKSP